MINVINCRRSSVELRRVTLAVDCIFWSCVFSAPDTELVFLPVLTLQLLTHCADSEFQLIIEHPVDKKKQIF